MCTTVLHGKLHGKNKNTNMKKIIFLLSFLFSIAQAQDISISKTDIDRVFGLPQGAKLFDNAVFSANDTLLVKINNYVTSRLSKYKSAWLSITNNDTVYVGRMIKPDSVYYELKKLNTTTYIFVKKDPKDILLELSPKHFPEENFDDAGVMMSNEEFSDIAKRLPVVMSQIPVDNDLALAQAGWGCFYMDLEGGTLTSSMWNYGSPLVYPGVTFRNNADSLNLFMARLKTYMYPFAVVVTTDINVYNAAPSSKRIRCIVTPYNSWYSASTLGVGYVSSFTWGDGTPFFVFQAGTNASNFNNLIETAKHEFGHPLGLYHQSKWDSIACTLQQSYNQGFGTGELSWGPTMGYSVGGKNVQTFGYGPTPNGCSFRQDNLNIILTTNGFGYRYNSAAFTGYVPNVKTLSDSARGQGAGEKSISSPNFLPIGNDSASYKIVIYKTGTSTITATPSGDMGASGSRPLMRLKSRLYNESGQIVASSDDAVNSTSAIISQAIAPGTYYLMVSKYQLPESVYPGFYNNYNPYYGLYGWFYITMD